MTANTTTPAVETFAARETVAPGREVDFTVLNRPARYAEYVKAATAAFLAICAKGGKPIDPRALDVILAGPTASVLVRHGVVSLTLPGFPADRLMTGRETARLTGFWLHETIHVLFTDWTAWERACREGLQHIVNGLEDVRGEALLYSRGVAANIRPCVEMVLADFLTGSTYDPRDRAQLPFTLALYGRVLHLGYRVKGTPSLAKLKPAQRDAITVWTRRAIACADTFEVLALAREIAGTLTGTLPPPPPPPPVNEGNCTGGNGPDSPDNDKPGDEPGDEPGEGGKGKPGDEPGEGGDEPGDEPGEGSEGGDEPGEGGDEPGEGSEGSEGSEGGDEPGEGEGGKGTPGDEPGDEGKPGRGASKGTRKPGDGLGKWTYNGTGRGGRPRPADRVMQSANEAMKVDDAHSYNGAATTVARYAGYTLEPLAMVAPVGMVSPVLANDVRRAVKAAGRVDMDYRRRNGRLSGNALARGLLGDEDCFQTRRAGDDATAAVVILLDISGSMGVNLPGGRAPLIGPAIAMTEALGDALAAAGAPFEVHGYGNPTSGQGLPGGPACTLFAAKTFNQPWQGRRDRVAQFRGMTEKHGTHIMPALFAAGDRLTRHAAGATSKIVFILTDGEDAYPWEAGKAATTLLGDKGITVVALGIGVNAAHLASRPELSVTVNDVRDLETGAFKVVATALERQGVATAGV